MIKAIIHTTSVFVDRPKMTEIILDENQPAIERQLEDGNLSKSTIGELYEVFKKGNQYIQDGSEPADHLTADMFENWFFEKYVRNSGLMQRLISVEYIKF